MQRAKEKARRKESKMSSQQVRYMRIAPTDSRIMTSDCATTDEFEVSIFLTELSTRHSLLTKHKDLDKKPSHLRSNSSKLTSWLTSGNDERPIDVPDDPVSPPILREEDDDVINLDEVPDAGVEQDGGWAEQRLRKRSRNDSEDALFVNDDGESEDSFEPAQGRPDKRQRSRKDIPGGEAKTDDKKKLGFNTSYDGFSIYGRILCLVVKRRGGKSKTGFGAPDTRQQMLENWVSTQAAQDQDVGDDDEG